MLVYITFYFLVTNTIEVHTIHFSFGVQIELDLPIIFFFNSFLHSSFKGVVVILVESLHLLIMAVIMWIC